jgi:DNA-binding NarL/FixJ family response regulator
MPDATSADKCILVVDDDVFNREGLMLYLRSQGYTVAGAGNEADAYALAEKVCPWAAVIDIVIPVDAQQKAFITQSVGVRLARRLKALDPAMGIVIFSAYEDRGSEIWSLVRDGARSIAYLLKGTRPERLLDALRSTAAGHVLLDGIAPSGRPRLAEELAAYLTAEERPWVERAVRLLPTLNEREEQVARRVAASQTQAAIAEALSLAVRTVEGYVRQVYKKTMLSEVDDIAPTLRKSTLLAKAYMIYDLYHNDPGRGR